jgi:hypothetical protein
VRQDPVRPVMQRQHVCEMHACQRILHDCVLQFFFGQFFSPHP